MDASIPPIPRAPSLSPGEQALLRWLPRINIIGAVLMLLWMIPSWWILRGMFSGLPVEAQPPSLVVPLLVSIPGVVGLCLAICGICLARQRGYVACMVISALTLFGGPLVILGLVNIVFLARPAVRALFPRNAR